MAPSTATAQVLSMPEAPVVRRSRIDYIDPHNLSILPQVRPEDEYDPTKIARLADSIADYGLLENPTVVELDAQHVRPYLAFFTIAFGKKLTMRNVVADHASGHYLVVVFGHRRTLAMRLLFERGCSKCDSAEQCRARHLARHGLDQGMETKVRLNLDPETAYRIQDAENTKEDVSRHAQVTRLREGWLMARRLHPEITKAEYARGMNRKPEEIYDAIRYCELPTQIHEAVKLGTTNYTVAVELTRLQAAGFDDDTIVFVNQYIRTEGMTSTQAARHITGRIKAREDEPLDIAELFVIEDPVADRAKGLGRSAERTAHRTFATEALALQKTAEAIAAGLVPRTGAVKSDLVRGAIERGDAARRHLLGV